MIDKLEFGRYAIPYLLVATVFVNSAFAVQECWRCCINTSNMGWHAGGDPTQTICWKVVPPSHASTGFAPPSYCISADQSELVNGPPALYSDCDRGSCTLYCDPSENCDGNPNNIFGMKSAATASNNDCGDSYPVPLRRCSGGDHSCLDPE
jgi:hypothetical protein